MLPYIRHHNGLLKLAVDRIQDIHRPQALMRPHSQRVLMLPALDLFEPFFCIAAFYILLHLHDRFFRVRYDGHIHGNISGNGCGIDIDMDDLRIGRKGMELSGDPVIEPGADGKQQIALAHRHIGRIGAVHSQIADEQRMVCGDRPPSHDRGNHRHTSLIHHLREYLVGLCDIYASPCQEQGPLCFMQHLQGTLELSDMDIGIGLVAADIHILGIIRASQLRHHVLGQIDQHRSRPACPCDIKSFLDDPAQIRPVADGHTVLCDASCDPHNVHFLKRVISDEMARHLPCKAYQRHTVIIGRCQSCHQIGGPRSAGDQTDPGPSRGPCISVRLMHQRLLMPGKDHPDITLPV